MDKLITIYRLLDPETKEVRYVGKTARPTKRLHEHTKDARRGRKSHLANWIRILKARPLMEVIRS